MSGIANALPHSETDPVAGLPWLREFGRLERDKMVGAAGELFVRLSEHPTGPSANRSCRSTSCSDISIPQCLTSR